MVLVVGLLAHWVSGQVSNFYEIGPLESMSLLSFIFVFLVTARESRGSHLTVPVAQSTSAVQPAGVK